jgi:hypothetical protein
MKVTYANNIEVYKFREVSNSHLWANIYIDVADNDKDGAGAILIRSDYGSWDFFWGSCGSPFKKFLTEIGKDYLTGKLCGADKEFRQHEWQIDARRIVDEYFADYDPEDEGRASAIEELDDIDKNCNFHSSEGMYAYLNGESPTLTDVFSDSGEYPNGNFVPRQLEMFVEQIWPVFVEELKKEI